MAKVRSKRDPPSTDWGLQTSGLYLSEGEIRTHGSTWSQLFHHRKGRMHQSHSMYSHSLSGRQSQSMWLEALARRGTFQFNCFDARWGHSNCSSSAIHSYQCVVFFRASKQRYGCQCLGVLLCAQMLMHATACWDCTDTVRESALKHQGAELSSISLGFTLPTNHNNAHLSRAHQSHEGSHDTY